MKLKLFHISSYIVAGALALSLGGCRDDLFYNDDDCPVGEEATVSLTFNAPEREQYTRSALSAAQDNQVNSLWIGIFNAESGRCTTNLHVADGDYGFTAGDKRDHEDIRLTGVPTVSGTSRIVAVANPDNQRGRKVGDSAVSDLSAMLGGVTNWDEYLKISVALEESSGETANVQTPQISNTKALVMSGSFVPSDYDGHGSTWDNDLLNRTVAIYPGNQSLEGKVHLRRLLSHITFNIIPEGNIVDIEPLNWQVNNAPEYSWMHERTDYGNYGQEESSRIQATNAGDAITPSYSDNKNYKQSLIYTTTDFVKNSVAGDANNRTQYSFDFWMFENKRQGLENCTDYQKREIEYGGTPGALIEPDPTSTDKNYGMSGVFVSLTGTDVTLNNKAAYVDIPCVVTYIVDTNNANSGADKGNITLPTGAKRTAQMTYRVHLGYVGTTPNARDFNSYRNSSYTYNVRIQSLQNVVVEAFRKGDEQPGGFGIVTDVTDQYYDLDAHYNAFNIYLSDADLRSFSFNMVSYYDGTPHEIYGGLEEGTKENFSNLSSDERKFYSWIEFKRNTTQSANSLEAYPGVGDNTLLHLGDLVPDTPGTAKQSAGYYTVFVNEYVYEDSANEEGTNWRKYVNQPNRNVWINVTENISADGASTYYQAKYAFSQKSIQSYYSTASSAGNTSALGAEHENENFGMNIRWRNRNEWSVGTTGGATTTVLDNENGRWNAWLFASNTSYGAGGTWSNAVDFTAPQIVNGITNTNQDLSSIYPDRYHSGQKTWTVPRINLISSGNLTGTNHWNSTATDYDPQRTGNSIQYIEGFYACMNRNRDLDGDGQITADEIRWFLPTSGQMLRLILGRNGLKTPIMNYPNVDLPQGSGWGHDVLFHYLTSDYKIIWTEEGMSSSEFGSNQYQRAPWEVRCIRNLGTNLSASIQRNNRVSVAYSTDVDNTTKGGVVKPTHYYGSALRNPATGPVQIHKTNDPLNRLAQYGFEIAPRGNEFDAESYSDEQRITTWYDGTSNNPTETVYEDYVLSVRDTLCHDLNAATGRSGWRVPTQKEIIIMLRTIDSNNNSILNYSNSSNGYFCVTQEYWENIQSKSSPSMTPGPNYRFCTVAESLAEAKNLGRLSLLRCVRDLTAEEANLSYSEIISQTRAKAKRNAVKGRSAKVKKSAKAVRKR